MAFTFPSRRPRALFYPTLHVHDGHVPERASFDHSLYCQTDDGLLAETFPFSRSEDVLGKHVDAARAGGLINGEGSGFRNALMFDQPNADHWYEAPACAGAHVLRGKGELFEFKLSATAAYYTEYGRPVARAWQEAARTKLDALHAGLHDGLAALTAERRETWDLVPMSDELTATWLSNNDVYGLASHGPLRQEVGSECAIRLPLSTDTEDLIEAQQVVLGFRRVPAPERVAEIREALNAIVRAALH
jgi:hypothetical protein